MTANDLMVKAAAKAILYNLLAQAFNYPDDAIASDLASGRFGEKLEGVLTGNLQEIIRALHVYSGKNKDEILLDLERDYTWMFFASKPRIAYLFGSVYGEGKLYQESTFEITRLYYETGLKLDESFKLPPDHIAVELEFMAYLAFNEQEALKEGNKENAEYAAGMQERVLNDYLSPLALNVGDRIADQAKTVFYQTMGNLLKALFRSYH
ncbi:MAG: Chaperone protein TorD [Syntrophorhabdus sp. PtaU1.Bin153]|nr:MAG: Chaperone protein TorD [Syntrophorhabdus sp. PtaU1.Bin153]